ncbi:hypothetical protein BUALT_Bualt04G0086900 [Buddleja alternifolia]|uniref:Transposase n=1 Tax=Buddleja alternifolia TaxID=168488 RepID=A0AAV6XU36_9LAMI|nr:hypothetical protein BUALT_Bualt04G0086900 [Buddleja alternifolia]
MTKRSINITTNDKTRIYAKCADKTCKWKAHANNITGAATFQIRSYNPDHTCDVSFKVKNMKSKWIAQKYLKKFKSDPKRNVKGFRRTNPGSTVIVGTDGSSGELLFDRFYVGLYALKVGFSKGCKPFIGVDGCHLKGPHQSVLLTVVDVDPNNNKYPICYAVKGLIKAFSEVFPNSPHRFCVRHLNANFVLAGFRGQVFKNALWRAANPTTENEFSNRVEEINALNTAAFAWFNDKPPQEWCKAYFSTNLKCDMLLNNVCETFNGNILRARELSIVSMLEWITEDLMKRLQENRDRAKLKWKSEICPRIKKIISKRVEKMGSCMPIKSDDMHYLGRKRKVTSLKANVDGKFKKKVAFLRSTTISMKRQKVTSSAPNPEVVIPMTGKTSKQSTKPPKKVSSSLSIPEVNSVMQPSVKADKTISKNANKFASSAQDNEVEFQGVSTLQQSKQTTKKKPAKKNLRKPTHRIYQLVDEDEDGDTPPPQPNPPYPLPATATTGIPPRPAVVLSKPAATTSKTSSNVQRPTHVQGPSMFSQLQHAQTTTPAQRRPGVNIRAPPPFSTYFKD